MVHGKKITKKLLALFMIIAILVTSLPMVMASAAGEDDVDLDLAWLNLGDTSNVTSNLTLPATGPNGSTITWSSGGSSYLWDDGTVIRPPMGNDDSVTLTATVSSGSVSKTKDFSITIPAYAAGFRSIASVETDLNIDVQKGTCPKLPYRVWVTYTDGYAEWRQTQWQWSGSYGSGPIGSLTPTNIEDIWKAYPVGKEYTVKGWITGDETTNLGYPLTANVTVVADPASVPAAKVADTLPMSKVTLTGNNRLTSNTSRAVTANAGWNADTYLYNYRDTFGLSTQGASSASGWEAPTCHLKGHGVGHFINGLCLSYVSGQGTDAQRKTILDKITYMIDEMRAMQELTFVKQEDGTWLEASETWTYEEMRALPLVVRNSTGTITDGPGKWSIINENKDPSKFGYGYINAIPPQHLVMNEMYVPYNDTYGVWAPYYGVHKQLAGLMDVYYTFKDDPATRATAEKALLICKDMCHWISERLTNRCYVGDTRTGGENSPDYGNLNTVWFTNISGEYGGVNEAIARCAAALDDDDPDKALLLAGSEMFDNKSYWDSLAVNSEIMSLNGNSHANQRIPQMPGVLWSYNGNKDPRYYNIAKNFWDFVQGRFRYYGGNVGNGEWIRAPYTQIANIATQINETCCATNLARLAKDLATYEPDNAEYIDAYERLMYNQLVGSLWQNSWSLTYQYSVGPNANKPSGNSNPGSTCCGGTGAENHARYTDATYFTSNDTIWVNMYMPTNCVWDVAGVTVKQDCTWPAENSTITVTPNVGETQKPFSMHLRVPWWATKGFDIKLNGVSIANSYQPSSYVVIPERVWSESDVVEVTCPFVESLDYGPDKNNNSWVATIFYGPMAMTGTGAWSTLNINSDLSNIVKNGAKDIADTSSTTPGNNRTVYTMSVAGNSTTSELQPDYYRFNNLTHYYRINLLETGDGTVRRRLYPVMQEAKALPSGNYSSASFANLQTALSTAISVYQNEDASQQETDGQVTALRAAINALVPTAEGKADLLALINQALARKAEPEAWAPYGFARMLAQLEAALTVYDNNGTTLTQVNAAYDALEEELRTMRVSSQDEIEDLDELKALLVKAKGYKKTLYTPDSFEALSEAIAYGDEVVDHVTQGTSTSSGMIPAAVGQLQDAIDGLAASEYPEPVNLWAGVNYTFFNGSSNICIEALGNTDSVGREISLWDWRSGYYNYVWRIVPDANNEYFQIRRQSSGTAAIGNALSPIGGTVWTGTILTILEPSNTDGSQWWKFELQPDGQYIIINKTDPTLCIAAEVEPATGVKLILASLDAPYNTWRIGDPNNAAPAVSVTKAILKVTAQNRITVPVGTPISSITLPSRVPVTYTDYTGVMRNVTWDTANYDGDVDGLYTLTGTIALDGIETNPNNIKASIEIVVGSADSLLKLIDKCNALNEDDFTEASWAVMEVALANATSVLYNPDARNQLNQAYNKLAAAYAGLVTNVDPGAVIKTELAIYIEVAEDILVSEANELRPSTINALQDALTLAKYVNSSKYATQEMVDDVAFSLLKTIVNRKDIVDKSDLNELIAIVEGLDSSKFEESTWTALTEALANAKLIDDESNAAEVTSAYRALQEAFNGLELKQVTNKKALLSALNNAKAILDDINSFVPSSVAGLADLYAQAKAVYDSADSTQDQVTSITNQLVAAIAKARAKADTTALVKALAQASSLNASSYTSASYAALASEMKAAQAVVGNVEVTQAEVDKKTTALNNAINGLVPVTASVKVSGLSKNMVVGETATAKATVTPSNADKTVKWTSSDSKVASINASTGKVTAKSAGKATITATVSGKTATYTITVHQYVSMKIGSTKAIQNGNKVTIDNAGTKPFKIGGRTMIPVRFVGEKMGGKVKYVSDSQPITMTYGDITVELKLGSKSMKVIQGGKSKTVTLDVAAQKKNGKTYIPLRAISESLGFAVYYEAGSEYIVVNSPAMSADVRNARLTEAKGYIK